MKAQKAVESHICEARVTARLHAVTVNAAEFTRVDDRIHPRVLRAVVAECRVNQHTTAWLAYAQHLLSACHVKRFVKRWNRSQATNSVPDEQKRMQNQIKRVVCEGKSGQLARNIATTRSANATAKPCKTCCTISPFFKSSSSLRTLKASEPTLNHPRCSHPCRCPIYARCGSHSLMTVSFGPSTAQLSGACNLPRQASACNRWIRLWRAVRDSKRCLSQGFSCWTAALPAVQLCRIASRCLQLHALADAVGPCDAGYFLASVAPIGDSA